MRRLSLAWFASTVVCALVGCASAAVPQAYDRGVTATASGTVAGLHAAIEQGRPWAGRIVGTIVRADDSRDHCEEHSSVRWLLRDDTGWVRVELERLDTVETPRWLADRNGSVVADVAFVPSHAVGGTASDPRVDATRLQAGPPRPPEPLGIYDMAFGLPGVRTCKVCGRSRGEGRPEEQY